MKIARGFYQAVFSVMAFQMLLVAPSISNAETQNVTQVIQERSERKMDKMTINIDLEGDNVRVALDDTPAAREFISLLPLTLDFKDYGSTEKITYLPRKLSVKGEPSGYTPVSGDFSYYAPWGNIAIFLKDFGYSHSLVKLGRVESGMAFLERKGDRKGIVTLVK